MLLPPIKLAVDGITGAFLIDPDRAEKFITEVEACADALDDARTAAKRAGDIRPPGGDLVTDNAVIQISHMAGNAHRAMTEYQRQLRGTAAVLTEQLAAYRAAEQANTARSG